MVNVILTCRGASFRSIVYASDSQPGVCVPPGVQTRHFGVREKIEWWEKAHMSKVLNINIEAMPVSLIIPLLFSLIIRLFICHNSVALVRERTIPTERPPPIGEVSANFCG